MAPRSPQSAVPDDPAATSSSGLERTRAAIDDVAQALTVAAVGMSFAVRRRALATLAALDRLRDDLDHTSLDHTRPDHTGPDHTGPDHTGADDEVGER